MALYVIKVLSQQNYLLHTGHYGVFRAFSDASRKVMEYRKCYHILEIPETSDSAQIRQAYLHLAKKYHPDYPNGDLEKFQEVDNAFRTLIDKKARERWDVEDQYEMAATIEEDDIRHTAPQHRQYLSNEGVGSGTPFQREKQYTRMRVIRAADNVLQHRIAKVTADGGTSLVEKTAKHKHNTKTQCGFDRLVEDLIQEAMSKGEFNNLPGSGKPLKSDTNHNPYVDTVTHKINQVLIENGFTPQWITMQKEIRAEIDELRRALRAVRTNFGPAPLATPAAEQWVRAVDKFAKDVVNINKKIDHFNLVVPCLNKQMIQVNLRREADDAMVTGRAKCVDDTIDASSNNDQHHKRNNSLFNMLAAYFKL